MDRRVAGLGGLNGQAQRFATVVQDRWLVQADLDAHCYIRVLADRAGGAVGVGELHVA